MFAAFEEATSITVGLVAFPVIFLIVGVFLDKLLSTTPVFIFIGIIAGVGIGIYRAMDISQKHSKLKLKIKKKQKSNV